MPQSVGTTHRKHLRHQRLGRYRKDVVSRFSLWLAREAARLSVTSERALRDSLRAIGLLSPAEIEAAGTAAAAGVLESTLTLTFTKGDAMAGSPDLDFSAAGISIAGAPDLDFSASGVSMAGGPDITISGGDTITRSAGDFATDGFAAGDVINISGAGLDPGNVGQFTVVTAVGAVITVAETLVNEGPISSTAIVTVDAIDRAAGSFVTDGFQAGDVIVLAGAGLDPGNVGLFTIATVAATRLTTVEQLTRELAISAVSMDTVDAIVRSTGSFVTDGFLTTEVVNLSVPQGAANVANGGRLTIDVASALVMTFSAGATGFVKELAVSGAALTQDDTVTRSAGDWAADGYAAGDTVRITDSVSNDGDLVIENFPSAAVFAVRGNPLVAEVATASVIVSLLGAGQ